MNKIQKNIGILIMLILVVPVVSSYPFYYNISMNYNRGEINIQSVNVIYLPEEVEESFEGYYASILDDNENSIDKFFFEIPNKVISHGFDEETEEITYLGESELDEISFEILIPYNEDASEIRIYNAENKELDNKEVLVYSEKVDERLEEGVGLAEGKKVDEEKEIVEGDISKGLNLGVVLIGVIILSLIIIYFVRKKK